MTVGGGHVDNDPQNQPLPICASKGRAGVFVQAR